MIRLLEKNNYLFKLVIFLMIIFKMVVFWVYDIRLRLNKDNESCYLYLVSINNFIFIKKYINKENRLNIL